MLVVKTMPLYWNVKHIYRCRSKVINNYCIPWVILLCFVFWGRLRFWGLFSHFRLINHSNWPIWVLDMRNSPTYTHLLHHNSQHPSLLIYFRLSCSHSPTLDFVFKPLQPFLGLKWNHFLNYHWPTNLQKQQIN